MSGFEELMQAALTAPDERKAEALRVLRGDSSPAPAGPVVEPYLTLREVSKRIGISPVSLWRWQVPGHDLAGRRRFRLSEVAAYLESEEFRARAEELKQERRAASA